MSTHSQDAVRDIMKSPVVEVGPGTSLRAASAVLHGHEIGAVPVVEAGRLVGVLSERDVVRALAEGAEPDGTRVESVMTAAPRAIEADSPLWAAAMLMLRVGVRHIPVVDGGRVAGMVSIRDALAVLERDRLVEPGPPPARRPGRDA